MKLHVCPLGMCVVLVPNIGISTNISNITQIRPQHFKKVMCVHWESVVVLVPNIGISTRISNITQIRPQHFRKVMCVQLECAWCQCQILVLAPAYPTLHKYARSRLETSCVSTGNERGASAKYLYQHQYIKHYTNTPAADQKLHVCPLGMCMVLVPNIGIRNSISSTTQIRPQQFRNFMCFHWECACCQCELLILAPAYPTLHKYVHRTSGTSCVSAGNVCRGQGQGQGQDQCQGYPKVTFCKILVLTPPYLKLHRYSRNTSENSCQGIRVVLVPNIGISTSISNTTQIRPQHFRNFMCVHWECAWCQCQILVLAPAYPTLHKYVHRTSGTSCVSTGNVRGASDKYWYQHQHIQHYTNTPAADQKLHVCPLGMCVVLVPNICISTSISNTTQIRPQQIRNFMCVHWECAWCQCQILVLATAYPTLHKYAHSSLETSCVSTGNVRVASVKY